MTAPVAIAPIAAFMVVLSVGAPRRRIRVRRRLRADGCASSAVEWSNHPFGRATTVVARLGAPLAALLLAGPFGAAVALAVQLLVPHVRARRTARLRTGLVSQQFPDLVDLLVLTIRSGCTPAHAVRLLAGSLDEPVRSAVTDVNRRVAEGQRFADAIRGFVTQLGPIAQPLVDSLALADRHGTPLAPILDRLAEESRAQRRRNSEAAARQLPIRLSFPLVGCTLPSFVLLTVVPLMAGTLSSLPGIRS